MATQSVHMPRTAPFLEWFGKFLHDELAPYPGRGALVARMIISATLSMIIVVTFRIPGGAIGALCAFLLSRENLLSTAKSGLYLVIAFAIGGAFVPVGARFFASTPMTHFCWEAVSLFVVFYLLRALTNFALAAGISVVATSILSIWYVTGPPEHNVELTLWQVLAAFVGVAVTLTVEIVFHALSKSDEVMDAVTVRLHTIHELLAAYASGQPIPAEVDRKLSQFAMVGLSGQRRHIARTNYDQRKRIRLTALVSLTGRSIDFAAALSNTIPAFDESRRERICRIQRHLESIQAALAGGPPAATWEPESDPQTPLTSELETMLSLIPTIFLSESAIDPRFQIVEDPPAAPGLFVPDAFTNPEHLRYTLSGTLAAMLCYVTYVSLAWPGISTAVTTCVLTALSNVGASRQRQVLRIIGVLLGGFVFGLGSQIFVLPYIDSISGFAVLFAVVTGIAAWVSTASSRLSYVGLQIAFAFYLINLSEFNIQISLTIGRDRAVGVLLGTVAMWVVFERLYNKPAADLMVRLFIKNLRLMAELIQASQIGGGAEAIVGIRSQRDQVFQNFGAVNAQADAVPFETGPERAGHMAGRDRIHRWQAELRTFYIMEVPLLQFRLYGDSSTISQAFRDFERRLIESSSSSLLHVAKRLEARLDGKPFDDGQLISVREAIALNEEQNRALSARERALVDLTNKLAPILDRLEEASASEPIFSPYSVARALPQLSIQPEK